MSTTATHIHFPIALLLLLLVINPDHHRGVAAAADACSTDADCLTVYNPSTDTCVTGPPHCDIFSGSCAWSFRPPDVVCRPKKGCCDKPEFCTGRSKSCPRDAFEESTTECRAAVIAADGTSCDETEYCTGNSPDCPPDGYKPSSSVCRDKKDRCDSGERCTGQDWVCPPDKRNDFAFMVKCGPVCNFCGLPVEQHGWVLSRPSGCVFNPCKSFDRQPWPSCANHCINSTFPFPCDKIERIVILQCINESGYFNCGDTMTGKQMSGTVCLEGVPVERQQMMTIQNEREEKNNKCDVAFGNEAPGSRFKKNETHTDATKKPNDPKSRLTVGQSAALAGGAVIVVISIIILIVRRATAAPSSNFDAAPVQPPMMLRHPSSVGGGFSEHEYPEFNGGNNTSSHHPQVIVVDMNFTNRNRKWNEDP